MKLYDVGMIGLAVMGKNLAINMEDKGFSVLVYNRELSWIDIFLEERETGSCFGGAYNVREFVEQLKRPRIVMMMIRAGSPVDEMLDEMLPFLDAGDIVIDGGNSRFLDTEKRQKKAGEKGVFFVGCGVSGGEQGALHGPSLMPGGDEAAWVTIRPLLEKISAKTDDNTPCCRRMGSGGSGHFVKMVHNGIEYGDMELICEAYHLMKALLCLNPEETADIFEEWNKGKLESYLIEITAEIMRTRDKDGSFLLDHVLDRAGQKGTGKWAAETALEEGVPLTLVAESVFARYLSANKEERVRASRVIGSETRAFSADRAGFLQDLQDALYASKIVSYAQGFAMLKKESAVYGWKLNYGDIALTWQGGCIIRSVFLKKIRQAYEAQPDLENLLTDSFFRSEIKNAEEGWRRIVSYAALYGVPVPAFSSALGYYDSYRSKWLPANLLQAQRDYFGAHTYERTDAEEGCFFHTDWTGSQREFSVNRDHDNGGQK